MPLSRVAAIAALATALAAAGAAQAQAQAQARCAPAPPPRVLFTLKMTPAELDHSRGSAELRRDAKAPRPDWHTMGLYEAELAHRAELAYRIAQVDDRLCVTVQSVHVFLEMPTRIIHVARDLDPASCRYRVTLDHERQHEAVDEAFLRQRLPREVQALRDEFAGLATAAPVPAARREQTLRTINAGLKAIVDRMFERFFAERAAAQAALDSPQEYDRLAALCR